jgi:hypothetical protein
MIFAVCAPKPPATKSCDRQRRWRSLITRGAWWSHPMFITEPEIPFRRMASAATSRWWCGTLRMRATSLSPRPPALAEQGAGGAQVDLLARPAAVRAGGLGAADAGGHALLDEVALESGDHVGEQAPCRGGGVEAPVAGRDEVDPLGVERFQGRQDVLEAAPEAVELPDSHEVGLSAWASPSLRSRPGREVLVPVTPASY